MAKEKISLGKKLRALREEKHMGIKTAAPRVKVSYTYLSKIENGHKAPTRELLERLCEIYGADTDEIIAQLGELPNDIAEIIRSNGSQVFELIRAEFPRGSIKKRKEK